MRSSKGTRGAVGWVGLGALMGWTCARDAIGLLVAAGLIVTLSAGPVAAQEGDGEVPRERPRFDAFFGGGVNFVEDLGTPVTLDAGVTAWFWEWWGGTWGGGAWFMGPRRTRGHWSWPCGAAIPWGGGATCSWALGACRPGSGGSRRIGCRPVRT